MAAITASTSNCAGGPALPECQNPFFPAPVLRFQQQMNAHLRQPMLQAAATSGGINDARILAALSISVTVCLHDKNPSPVRYQSNHRQQQHASGIPQLRFTGAILLLTINVSINSRPGTGGTKALAPVAVLACRIATDYSGFSPHGLRIDIRHPGLWKQVQIKLLGKLPAVWRVRSSARCP